MVLDCLKSGIPSQLSDYLSWVNARTFSMGHVQILEIKPQSVSVLAWLTTTKNCADIV